MTLIRWQRKRWEAKVALHRETLRTAGLYLGRVVIVTRRQLRRRAQAA